MIIIKDMKKKKKPRATSNNEQLNFLKMIMIKK